VAHDLRHRRHRPDLEPVLPGADAAQLGDPAEIDQRRGTLDAVLQPVEAVEAARQDPRAGAVAVEQRQRRLDRGRLQQLERRHHITDHCHRDLTNFKAQDTNGWQRAAGSRQQAVGSRQ
jgi:hypothetical protein